MIFRDPNLLSLVVAVAAHGAIGDAGSFEDAACGISFSVPKNWLVVKGRKSMGRVACEFDIRPKNLKQLLKVNDVDSYTISVRIRRLGFKKAISETAFEKQKDGWLVRGRLGVQSPAASIRGMPWFGVRGTASIGCFHVQGGYAGMCDVPTALIGSDTTSAELWGGEQGEKEFETVVRSFRFLPPNP